jgi:CheY-like chemotaxis protein
MKKYNILLIDDDEVNTFYIQYKLQEIPEVGEVFISENGQEALNQIDELSIAETDIDIILLDVNMPVMNGFEFLDIYQNLFDVKLPDTKVYVVTTSNDVKDSNRALGYACVEDYIDKTEIADRVKILLKS